MTGFTCEYVISPLCPWLQEEYILRPDAHDPREFLHRILNGALSLPTENPFDQRLEQAIQETSQEPEFGLFIRKVWKRTQEVLLSVTELQATSFSIISYQTIQRGGNFVGGKDQAFVIG